MKNWMGWPALLAAGFMAAPAQGVVLRVKVENLAPANGTFLTPVWVGFHDGSFDLYDLGSPASMALERIAEDGSVAPLMADFGAAQPAGQQGVIFGPSIPPIGPGEMSASLMDVDASNRYFSYASMIIPSNDAFVANGNPMAFPIFDAMGGFLGADFIVLGSMVRDAGTEVNDEAPLNTAFFGQMMPNTGTDENGVVHDHPGFNAAGSGGILDAAMFANADFKAAGYQVARITISAVPEAASTAGLLGLGLGALGFLGRKGGLNRKRA